MSTKPSLMVYLKKNREDCSHRAKPSVERDSSLGVPYGNRTRAVAVKEKRFTGIQRKPAAWIAP
jgi:hypothetical protein